MSYDPTIGRFISEDPIAFDGGDMDLYRYVGNEPTNAIDPSGLYKIIWMGDWTYQQRLTLLNQLNKVRDRTSDIRGALLMDYYKMPDGCVKDEYKKSLDITIDILNHILVGIDSNNEFLNAEHYSFLSWGLWGDADATLTGKQSDWFGNPTLSLNDGRPQSWFNTPDGCDL